MTDFRTWTHANLANFARDAVTKIKQQEEVIAALRRQLETKGTP